MVEELAVRQVAGTGVPIRGDSIDTDEILPARFLKTTTFDDVADALFYDTRFDDDGEPTNHPINRFTDGSIAVVNANFGCGSSREHAPQAMDRWGIDAVIGESFAEIFRDNCASIGLPALTADGDEIRTLQSWIEANPDGEVTVDVAAMRVTYDDRTVDASMDESHHEALVEGTWDTTAVMGANADLVAETTASLPYVGVSDPSGSEAIDPATLEADATTPDGGATDES